MKIELTNQTPHIALSLKMTAVSMEKVADEITEGYAKLMGYLAEQGKQIAGAPYVAYMNANADWTRFDMELGMPVSEAVPTKNEFYMSQTCEGKAICTTYKGAYKDIVPAYEALMDYAKENSLESTGVYYDYYLNDPADTSESELLTQIVFPIK